MAAPGSIAMGKLIYQQDIGAALSGGIQIQLLEGDSLIFNYFFGQLFQPFQQCQCIGAGVTFNVAHNNVYPSVLSLVSGLQHSISLADTRSISKKDF